MLIEINAAAPALRFPWSRNETGKRVMGTGGAQYLLMAVVAATALMLALAYHEWQASRQGRARTTVSAKSERTPTSAPA